MQLESGTIPYAAPQNIKSLILRLRDRGWADPLDSAELVNRLDIPAGSVSRVSIALRFLKLIDEDGHLTDNAHRLREADDDQYPQVLGDLLKSVYRDVFYKINDISTASENEISNAFRLFNPTSQKDRMVTLFKALCQEAGLVPEGTTSRIRTTPRQATKKPISSNGDKKRDATGETQPTLFPSEETASHPPRTGKNSRYYLLHGFIDTLPEDGTWTAQEHKAWLDAIVALTNYLVKEIETEREDEV